MTRHEVIRTGNSPGTAADIYLAFDGNLTGYNIKKRSRSQ